MTQIGMEDSSTERTQRIYAGVAGFLFLWPIITGLAGALTFSQPGWVSTLPILERIHRE